MIDIENDEKNKQNSRVKVAIRVRPMVQKEVATGQISCLEYQKRSNNIIIGKEKCFTFDRVFRENSTQQNVYDGCVKQLVMRCFEGYNAAVLAYGQTGSGKTYTMGTNPANLEDIDEMGIIPRVIDDFFVQVEKRKQEVEFIIKASFIEIYNEQIIDLLSNQQMKGQKEIKIKDNFITIREQKDGSMTVCGVNETRVTSPDQMLNLIHRGAVHRSTSTTLMNDSSSRSHGIFTIFLEQHPLKNEDENGFITAKFYFVDLAGSERAKKTGAAGLTLKQGININLGLLQLGNVISALSANEKKEGQFITYRNSKLTRILQDCLGGNSNTYMIACVSPAEFNYEESLNTLKYASKAMNIKNKPVINRDPHSAQINNLKQKIFQLQFDNKNLRFALENAGVKITQKQLDPRSDLLSEQIKRLYETLREKQKEIVEVDNDLKCQRKKNTTLQISNYELRREKDNLKFKLQGIKEQNPQLLMHESEERMGMVDEYLSKITHLENELYEQQKINIQLQNESEKLQKEIQKDESILLTKNKKIVQLKNQVKKLTQLIKGFEKQRTKNHKKQAVEFQSEESSISVIQISSDDEEYIQAKGDYRLSTDRNEGKLRDVSEMLEKQQHELQIITEQKINLQYQLISQMKEEYHKKIAALEKEKQTLRQQNERSGFEKNPKLNQRIENLQTQLRQLRKKAKEQSILERQVKIQNEKISKLGQEIKNFKIQKIELNRKIRNEKKVFQEFKSEKLKVLMKQKRQNIKKDGQIRKLMLENKKKSQMVAKTKDEISRVKKVNESVKMLLKGKKGAKNSKINAQKFPITNDITQKQLDKILQNSIQNLLFQEDKVNQMKKYSTKLLEMEEQLDKLYGQQAQFHLQKDRKKFAQYSEQDENDLKISQLDERIANIQEGIKFNQTKYDSLNQEIDSYDVQVEVIYNKKLNNIEIMRYIANFLYLSLRKLFSEVFLLKQERQQYDIECQNLQQQNENLKTYNRQMASLHEYNITRLREEMLMQLYRHTDEQVEWNQGKVGKVDEKQRRINEKKVNQLTKKNRELSAEVEMWRRKCSIVQEKYHNMNLKFAKDKFIGRPPRDDESVKYKTNSKNQEMLDEVNFLIGKMEHKTNNKKNYEDEDKNIPENEINEEYNKNMWECMGTINAHNSSVLSVSAFENCLISSATKSMKIWDCQTCQLVADLTSPALQGFVKCVLADQQNKLILCACEKQILIFDNRMFGQVATLRAHRDEVRALHKDGNYLLSAGKGSINSGGLFKWDLRGDTWFPLEQKEKNTDIFAMASHDGILYYGTRTHQVRRMIIDTMEIINPFEPPHMDTVTGLTVLNGYLISGSKDKYLRLWSLDTFTNSSTVLAFNDYINSVITDQSLPIFYSAARGGQIKMAAIESQKIRFIGGIMAHTQSVNSLCTLDEGKFVSASSDRTVKIWKPTSTTLGHLKEQYQF